MLCGIRRGENDLDMNKMTKREVIVLMLCFLVSATGFLLILGSIGALENDAIGFKQYFLQVSIGFGLWFITWAIAKIGRR